MGCLSIEFEFFNQFAYFLCNFAVLTMGYLLNEIG